MKKPRILIQIEGGMIQSIITDSDVDIRVLDYDALSVDEDQLIPIKNLHNEVERVWIEDPYYYKVKKTLEHYWKQLPEELDNIVVEKQRRSITKKKK